VADRLISLLVPRTVLVASGKSVGTGCFIAPGYILTCAHVVREPLPPGESIRIYYSATDPEKKELLNSAVVSQIILSDLTESKEYPDVAILKLEETSHSLLQLSPSSEPFRYRTDQEYLAVGFQKKELETGRNIAQMVSLSYEGEEDASYMRKIIFENGLIRPGMSGAPLVERQSGQIVGIVHMTRDANTDLGAIVIPVDKIWEVLKEKAPNVHAWLTGKKGISLVRREYRQAYPRFPMFRQYGIRLLLLPLILFFLFYWIFRNIGQIQQAEYVAALLVVIGFSGKLLSDWMGSDVSTETGNAKSKAGAFLFRPAVIGILGTLVLALWLCVTSVLIFNHDDTKRVSIKLLKELGSKTYRSKEFDQSDPMQFLVPMVPFHDTLYLEPDGSEPMQVVMNSFQRKELEYPDSFKLEPVVLLLFNPNNISFDSFSNYEVHIKWDSSGNEIVKEPWSEAGSLMIGKRHMEITGELEKEWNEQLKNFEDPLIIRDIIRKWKISYPITEADLAIGKQLEIKLVPKSGGQAITKSLTIDHEGHAEIINF
jgi:hypothetical protein